MKVQAQYYGSVADQLVDQAFQSGRKLTKEQKKIIKQIEKLENPPAKTLSQIYRAINEQSKTDEKISKLERKFKMAN